MYTAQAQATISSSGVAGPDLQHWCELDHAAVVGAVSGGRHARCQGGSPPRLQDGRGGAHGAGQVRAGAGRWGLRSSSGYRVDLSPLTKVVVLRAGGGRRQEPLGRHSSAWTR